MTPQEQDVFFSEYTAKQKAVYDKKRGDYATTSDVLSNFKIAAAAAGLTPIKLVLGMMAIKTTRLGNLMQNNACPNNESVEDSTIDGSNYYFILACLIEEQKQTK